MQSIVQPVAMQQPVVWVDEFGNPVQADPYAQQPVMYVDEFGNPVQTMPQEVVYVDANGQPIDQGPVSYVDALGQPMQFAQALPQAVPSVYNISPDVFERLAMG